MYVRYLRYPTYVTVLLIPVTAVQIVYGTVPSVQYTNISVGTVPTYVIRFL